MEDRGLTFHFPELSALRHELVTGLAAALAAGGLAEPESRGAAEAVIDGQGLPDRLAVGYGERPVCTLVGFDADAIHPWVFDSERVQVAAGASATLDDLNQRAGELLEIPGVCGTLYSAGGGGMLFASGAADPAVLREGVRERLEKQSHGLRFTVVAEPLRVPDLRPPAVARPLAEDALGLQRFALADGTRGALVRLQIALRTAKDSRPRPEPVYVEREDEETRAERCPSCGRRPPGRKPVTDTGPDSWCGHCQDLRKQLGEIARERFEHNGQAITFADLAKRIKSRRGYLGYVAIDGNSMGTLVQGAGGFLQLRAFSETTSAIYKAARSVVASEIERFKPSVDPEACYLSLLSGGDEVSLVLPATAAPSVAVRVLQAVEAGFNQATRRNHLLHGAFQDNPALLDKLSRAGAAAGVITAHANYPVRLLRRYANELQKLAKNDCARGHRCGLAWMLLTDSSPLTESLDRVAGDKDLGLSAFERLMAEAEAAERTRVPQSALRTLLSHYRQEERSLASLDGKSRSEVLDLLAANFFRYQLARSPDLKRWWEAVEGFETADRNDGLDAVGRWFQAGGGRRLEQLVDLRSLDPFPKTREVKA